MRRRLAPASVTRSLALAGLLALTGVQAACGLASNRDGYVLEVETGRNGVKLEVKDGQGDYEVYLVPDTTCRQGMNVRDCADRDDYLVPPTNHTPGLNRPR